MMITIFQFQTHDDDEPCSLGVGHWFDWGEMREMIESDERDDGER